MVDLLVWNSPAVYFVNLVPPLIGLAVFLKICRDMKIKEVVKPPYFPIFALFFGFGGWLMQLITALFWQFSGMSLLGFIFLLTLMPLAVFGCILWLFPLRETSKYHSAAWTGSWLYLCLIVCGWIFMLLTMGGGRT
jgi:hypothetical protein